MKSPKTGWQSVPPSKKKRFTSKVNVLSVFSKRLCCLCVLQVTTCECSRLRWRRKLPPKAFTSSKHSRKGSMQAFWYKKNCIYFGEKVNQNWWGQEPVFASWKSHRNKKILWALSRWVPFNPDMEIQIPSQFKVLWRSHLDLFCVHLLAYVIWKSPNMNEFYLFF